MKQLLSIENINQEFVNNQKKLKYFMRIMLIGKSEGTPTYEQ